MVVYGSGDVVNREIVDDGTEASSYNSRTCPKITAKCLYEWFILYYFQLNSFAEMNA